MRRIRVLLRGDSTSRKADALCEHYHTPGERGRIITGYIRSHAGRIAELTGVRSPAGAEDPERFLDVTDIETGPTTSRDCRTASRLRWPSTTKTALRFSYFRAGKILLLEDAPSPAS
jgi:hypothetical protein